MKSVSNAYVREARTCFRNLRDSLPGDLDVKVTCEFSGRKKRWETPPENITRFLFGLFVCTCESVACVVCACCGDVAAGGGAVVIVYEYVYSHIIMHP